MKKFICVLFLLLLSGCSNKVTEYKNVSDVVVNLFKSETYDEYFLNDSQKDLISTYLYDLENPEINVSKYIIYDDNYKTDLSNTEEIYTKKNICYVRYNDIKFEEPIEHGDYRAKLVCNGYYVMLDRDSVKPIFIDYNNPKYNYRYLGYYKKNGYNFAYRSYYDGSGLVVSIDDKIEVNFTNVDDLNLRTINNVSYKNYIIPGIVFVVLILFFVYLKKKTNYNKH